MKCKTCKKRMINILTDFDYSYDETVKRAVNVPAFQCPQCEKTTVPDIVLAQLKGYAVRECDDTVDYAKCKRKDDDEYVALHMMGLM